MYCEDKTSVKLYITYVYDTTYQLQKEKYRTIMCTKSNNEVSASFLLRP